MPEQTTHLLHAFSALADLGEELADTHDFEEMVRTTLHASLAADEQAALRLLSDVNLPEHRPLAVGKHT